MGNRIIIKVLVNWIPIQLKAQYKNKNGKITAKA